VGVRCEHAVEGPVYTPQGVDVTPKGAQAQEPAVLRPRAGPHRRRPGRGHERDRPPVRGRRPVRAALLRTWGYFSYYRGEHREAMRIMREARPIAVEAGDRYAEADTFLIEAMAASLFAPPEDAGRLADEVVRLGRSIGSLRIAGLGLAAGARAWLRQGNPSRAGRQLSAARQTLLGGGARNELLEVDFVDAGIHLDRGGWRRVAGPAGRGADGARASGWALYESIGPLLVGRALLGAGRPEEAAAFARAVDTWRQLGLTVWLARALSLQATAARHAADRPAADHLLTQADDVLNRLRVPAHARPTVLAPLGEQRGGPWVAGPAGGRWPGTAEAG
jgi:hypothetical protein